jgi:hypothetical protein
MSKVYDKAFKVGFLCNILLFVVLNIISFFVSRYKYANREIKFAPVGYPRWSFPDEIYTLEWRCCINRLRKPVDDRIFL